MRISFRRVCGLTAAALAILFWTSCGQVYRPVVIPVNNNPPNPANFHAVFGISNNVGASPGTVLQIDVSGDTDIGVANSGITPTHAAVLPNFSRVFAASAGSVIPGNADVIYEFTPAGTGILAAGLTTQAVYSLPNVGPEQSSAITAISESGNLVTATLSAPLGTATVGGALVISGVSIGAYNGNFTVASINGTTITYVDNIAKNLAAATSGTATVPLPTFCSYLPDFLATSQNTTMFVANYGAENGANCSFASTDSVVSLNVASGQISNIAYLNNPPSGGPAPHPVAMAETPNALHLYVVNQGNNTVLDLSPVDMSTQASIPAGNTPVWAVARVDNQRVYVLTQGDGMLLPIDTASDTVLPSQSPTYLSVGAGANFILYDSNLNRLYVTNPDPANAALYIFSATGGTDGTGAPNDTPLLLAKIPMTAGSAVCPSGCSPVSVAALPDGSRFYVASYMTQASCADGNVGATACMIPMLTVFDAPSMTVKPAASTLLPSSKSLSLLTYPPFSPTQYAVPSVASCAPPATYVPGTTRFRMFTTASADSSRVYVSMCDARAVATIATVTNTVAQGVNAPDTLVTDLSAPFAACNGGACSSSASITGFSINSNVVTFQAVNSFTVGTTVAISNLSSPAATNAGLNGQTLTVIATGLSATQFECVLPIATTNVGSTADTGLAVAQVPSQTPLFLVTGQ